MNKAQKLDLRKKFLLCQMESAEIDSKISELKAHLKNYDANMAAIEEEWLKTHKCSCELVGVNCIHMQKKG